MKLSELIIQFTGAGFTLSKSDPSRDIRLSLLTRPTDNALASILSNETSEEVFHVALFPDQDVQLATVLHQKFDLNAATINSLLNDLSSKIATALASNNHFYRQPKHCTSMHSQTCIVCDGGLSVCALCGHYEGALTTHCPGTYTYPNYADAVYAGTVDFRNGAWIEGVSSPHTPAHFKSQ